MMKQKKNFMFEFAFFCYLLMPFVELMRKSPNASGMNQVSKDCIQMHLILKTS